MTTDSPDDRVRSHEAKCVRLGDLAAAMASLPRLTPDEVDAFLADLDAARAERGRDIVDRWEP